MKLSVPVLLCVALPLAAQQLDLSWNIQYQYQNNRTGIHHRYYQQFLGETPIMDRLLQVQINAEGDTLLQRYEGDYKTQFRGQFSLNQEQAITAGQNWTGQAPTAEVEAKQAWEKHAGQHRPVWILTWPLWRQDAVWRLSIDAQTGEVLAARNMVVACTFDHDHNEHSREDSRDGEVRYFAPPVFTGAYRHLPWPYESPDWGAVRTMPADSLVDQIASPFGWHDNNLVVGPDYDYTRGNNVYAYYSSVLPPNPPPKDIVRNFNGTYQSGNVPMTGGTMNFVYDQSLETSDATDYLESEVIQLFVKNNWLHDLTYRYGFDEASGNFQEQNLSPNGLASDGVYAEAQDGPGFNKAFFYCPRDGLNPRMQMSIWDYGAPEQMISASFDNLVISHEYFHGVIFRMVGGPMNDNCMYNPQQGGEGFCDIFGALMTLHDRNGNGKIDEDVIGEGIRTIGNYLLNEDELGDGLRPAPYTNDMGLNPYTYADLPDMIAPHGVGFLWGSMLWDINLAFIDRYGFAESPQNYVSQAGNIRLINIMIESMRHMPCEPDFLDMRQALITANNFLYNGEGNGIMWEAFSRRGLGFSAETDGVAAFDMPPIRFDIETETPEVLPGEKVDFSIVLLNGSDDSLRQANITNIFPGELSIEDPGSGLPLGTILNWMIPDPIGPGDSLVLDYTLRLDSEVAQSSYIYLNNLESDASEFSVQGDWEWRNDFNEANSGSRFWFTEAPTTLDERWVELEIMLPPGNKKFFSFYHAFNLDEDSQGAIVEFRKTGPWQDAADRLRMFPYQGDFVDPLLINRATFNGDSDGYQHSYIDFSDLTGLVKLRFRLLTAEDGVPPGGFWKIDDFSLQDLKSFQQIARFQCAEEYEIFSTMEEPGLIVQPESLPLPVEWLSFTARPRDNAIRLDWSVIASPEHTGFWVERQHDRSPISQISWVDAIGIDTEQYYTFFDENVLPNVTYHYRLRQKDNDGQEMLSEWRSARLGGSPDQVVRTWPNPTQDHLQVLWIPGATQDEVTIEIYDRLGRLVQVKETANNGQVELDLSQIPSGLYHIKLDDNQQISNARFIKQ